jgi:hypothetical protein
MDSRTMIALALCAAAAHATAGIPPAGVPLPGRADSHGEAGVVRVVSARGSVSVRHGAAADWAGVAAGDTLKPEDSIRLEEGASASVEAGGKRIGLPAGVIVDVADLREMTRGDLLLRLAMEDVRSAPRTGPKQGEPGAARTTTTRAADRDGGPVRPAAGDDANLRRLAGTKVLHEYGFYGTCVLRSREIFRIAPALASRIDARLRVADALGRMGLAREAYEAYAALAGENLAPEERKTVEEKLAEMKEGGK